MAMAEKSPEKPFHFGEWLKFYFSERGIEAKAAAHQLGVVNSTIHRWFEAASPNIRPALRGPLAKLIGVDLRRLNALLDYAARGVPQRIIDDDASREADGIIIDRDTPMDVQRASELIGLRRIPFFDVQIAAGAWVESGPPRTGDDADGWIPVPTDTPSDAFALRIRGDCMEPDFPDGSTIVFVPVRPGEGGMQFDPGKPYYFEHSDGKATFKRVWFEPQRERWRLEPINPRYDAIYVPEQQMARLSRAVKLIRDLV